MAKKTESIVFIDAGVDVPLQLAEGIALNADVCVLSPADDGVEQIARILESRQHVNEIYIVAHGFPGEIALGNARLGLRSLPFYRPHLARWANANPTTLYLYGCHVAAGDAGTEFLSALKALTGANIAASSRLVGQADRGGTWDLDTVLGAVSARSLLTEAAAVAYPGVFATDDFPGTEITDPGTFDGDNTGATHQTGEPIHDPTVVNLSPAFQQDLNDSIWWTWTAPTSGLVNITTAGSQIDTVLAAYTGTALGNLTLVGRNDNATVGTTSSSLTFNASANTVYYFAVDGVGQTQGPVSFTLNTPPVITAGQLLSVSEAAAEGDPVGTVAASGDVGAWTIASGNPDNDGDGLSAFAIDETGQISVQDAGDLDFEGFDTLYTLKVTATDGAGFSDTESVFVEVTDEPEPPVIVSLNSPATANEGSRIALTGQISDLDTDDTQTITINWGDGTSTVINSDDLAEADQTFTSNHTYRDNGNFTIDVTVEDSSGAEASESRSIIINNVAPTITAGETKALVVDEDSEITFQLSATDPSSADVLTWSVEPASNGTADFTADPPNPTSKNQLFTYQPNAEFSGTDSFQIQVQDDDGGVDTIAINVEVTAQPDAPTNLVLSTAPAAIDEGETLTLTGSFQDPDAGDTFTVTVDWGDGTESTVLTEADLTFNAATNTYSFAADHQYLDDTASAITVSVQDSFGAAASASQAITINNLAPTITPGPNTSISINEDETGTVTFTATDSADTDFQWEIVTQGANGTASVASGVGETQVITYTPNPNFSGIDEFVVSVADGDGGVNSATVVVGIDPVNDAPTNLSATLSATEIAEGDEVFLSGSFKDVDNSATLSIDDTHTLTVDWGDGTIDVFQDEDLTDTETAEVSFADLAHVYLDEGETGSYTVTITATDEAGASVSTTETIAVNNLPPTIVDPDGTDDGTTTASVDEDSSLDFTLTATDPGVLDELDWNVSAQAGNGIVSVGPANPDGSQSFTYTPNLDFEGIDTFTLQVNDGDGGFDDITYEVTVEPQNDPPQIVVNQFDITEGQELLVDLNVLDAVDIEATADTDIVFSISGAAADGFLVAGEPSTTFTRQDLIDGAVTFLYDDEIAPTFSISVSDDDGATVSAPGNITFQTTNDAPVLSETTTPFTVTEGGTVLVRSTNISATDEETNDPDLVFTVSDVEGGDFLVSGVVGTTFTQRQINQNLVRFRQDGSDTVPSYTVTVSDGELTDSAVGEAILVPVNDPPILLTNQFNVTENQPLVVDTSVLDAIDEETLDDSQITFNITGPDAASFSSETFTLEDVLLGNVSFLFEGETPPTFTVEVTDADGGTTTEPGNVIFTGVNDAPTFVADLTPFTVTEGGTVSIRTTNINAEDPETNNLDLVFTVSDLVGGSFLVNRVPSSSFTLRQISQNQVRFQQDGTNTQPTYTLTVSDGEASTSQDFTATLNQVNDRPVIEANQITIEEGDTIVLDETNISAVDELGESTPEQLQYTVTNVTNGAFIDEGGAEVTTFTQQDIFDGLIRFQQDGSSAAPTYTLTLEDAEINGVVNTLPNLVGDVSFTAINDAPTLEITFPTVFEGDTIAIVAEGGDGDAVFSATDEDGTAAELIYTVDAIANGSFLLSGVETTTFSQADVVAGLVSFVHDGSEDGPSFTVTLTDSGVPAEAVTETVTPAFEGINDLPQLLNNTLTVNEGQTVTLTTSNLSATDVETDALNLEFSITNIQNGSFAVGGAPYTEGDTFTLFDVVQGLVTFTQDGSSTAPSYDVAVIDADGGVSVPPPEPAATIIFAEVNDAPELTIPNDDPLNPPFTILEGQIFGLDETNINAFDEDTPPEELVYTASNVVGGFFAAVTDTSTPITTFTQAEIDDRGIVFVHNGSNTAPSYTLTVDDGAGGIDTKNYTAGLTPVNDAPTITTNTLSLTEGETVTLKIGNLQATDEESGPTDLTYTIEALSDDGQFSGPGGELLVGDTFTQQDVLDGLVSFTHDTDSNNPPSYTLTVTDNGVDGVNPLTSEPSTVEIISFTQVNDAPVFQTDGLFGLQQGETVPINEGILLVTDEESVNPELIVYTVDSVSNGSFLLNGVPTTTFTQQDIAANRLTFAHDGSEFAPSYSLTVSDSGTPTAQTIEISVDLEGTGLFENLNDAPELIANTLAIAEGEAVVLTTDNLSATDLETSDQNLLFDITNIENGFFTVTGANAATFGEGEEITDASGTFTLKDVIEGRVSFTQNGVNTAPVYSVSVQDDDLDNPGITEPSPATVLFTAVNDDPDLLVDPAEPVFEIQEDGIIILTTDAIDAVDEEGETPQDDLRFFVSNVVGGFFAGSNASTAAITEFTRGDVADGEVVFVQDGSNVAPSYTLEVTDGDGGSAIADYTATLIEVNEAPSILVNELTLVEGAEVTLGLTNLSASDEESGPTELTYTIEALSDNGQFFGPDGELLVGGSFTQQDVIDGLVTFKHDETSNVAPSYSLSLTDSGAGPDDPITVGPDEAVITFEPINDVPTLEIAFPLVQEGAVIPIDPTILAAEDEPGESAPAQLVYTVDAIANASFQLNGASTTTFSQQDVIDNKVTFIHDDSEFAPSFTLSLTDNGTPEPNVLTETVVPEFELLNRAPEFVVNQFSPVEGDTTALTAANLSAIDEEDLPSQLLFSIDPAAVVGGQFFLGGTELAERTFTQADINFGRVTFKDDGDEEAPSYIVRVTDTAGDFTEAEATVTLTATNDNPTIEVNNFPISEGDFLLLTDANLLAQDNETTDPAQLTFTVSEVVAGNFFLFSDPATPIATFTQAQVNTGQVVFVQDGSSTVPSFVLTLTDPEGGSVVAAGAVEFSPVNDAPVAVDDSGPGFATNEDTVVTTVDLTLNDTDEENDNLIVAQIDGSDVAAGGSVELASGATATLNVDNSVSYDPTGVFDFLSVGDAVEDSFEYTVSDGNGGTDTAIVTLVIEGANDAPIATDDAGVGFATTEAAPVTTPNLLENDSDIDQNDVLTISAITTEGVLGTVTNNGDGTLTYDPAGLLNGLVQGELSEQVITYTVSDGQGGTAQATATIVVSGINNAPIAVDDSGAGFATDEDTPITTPNVLANDSDAEGPIALIGIDTSATVGAVTDNGDGTFGYDPTGVLNFLRQGELFTDTFTYTIEDSDGITATATVAIEVTGLVEVPDSFFDFEQLLRYQNPAAVAPAEEVNGLPLAQFFDERFYLSQNTDVSVAVQTGSIPSGYQHFIANGINEGRTPSALFNNEFYLETNPDVAEAIAAGLAPNALQHFLLFGNDEGRDPSALFSQSDYLTNNPDVAEAVNAGVFQSAFDHYVTAGAGELREPRLALYNESFYLETNPDVADAVSSGAFSDGYAHFVINGQFEGRAPSTLYSNESYLSLNPDVAEAVSSGALLSGFQHYQAFGRFEGREVFA